MSGSTRRPLVLGSMLAALVLSACGGSSKVLPAQRSPSPVVHLAGGRPAHVAVIVMENEEYGDVLSGSAPFVKALAARSALAAQMFATTHPSLPNYLALTGGSSAGISSDCTDCTAPGQGIAGQLERAHVTWKAYMEDLPHPCFKGAEADDYAKKHDPFIYYTGVSGNPRLCANIVPSTQLASDERAGRLPAFVWLTPNLCHDMHDCSVADGDRFLASTVPALLRALGPRGLLVLTWDEGSSDDGCCRLAHGGHIVTVLAGGLARVHARMSMPVDHYSVLRTIEDLFGLPHLGAAGCACTPSLAPLLRTAR